MLKSAKALRILWPAVLTAALAPAAAQACTIRVEKPRFVAEVEALNTTLAAGDYAGLQADIKAAGGLNASALTAFFAEKFPGGFSDCYTIVQRRDIGGLEQTISQFENDRSIIFVRWVTALERGRITVLHVAANTDLTDLMEGIR